MLCLGLDTSNYTTSAALYDSELKAVRQQRKMLPVAQGRQGLRQSDAVFLHVRQLPELIEELLRDSEPLSAVGFSARPRDISGSYMPCFLAGELSARSIAAALNIPCRSFSHQAGHIAAAVLGSGRESLMAKPFLALHASGGTTECLLVAPGKEGSLSVKIIGETLDLNAGQVIDRAGVMLGLGFPAGGELEALARGSGLKAHVKAVLKGGNCCFSGLENQCRAMLEKCEPPADIAAFCQASVAAALRDMAKAAAGEHPGLPFIFAGGVIRNEVIRGAISAALPGAIFAPPELSSDNAAGTAYLTSLAITGGNGLCLR